MAAEVKKGIDTTKNPIPFEMAQIPGPEHGQVLHAEGYGRNNQEGQEASARCGSRAL